jgi:FixJ family two-component response regulator
MPPHYAPHRLAVGRAAAGSNIHCGSAAHYKAVMHENRSMVVIVDDDQSVREATKSLLRSAGYNAEAYASAEEFLDALSVVDADCLILDVGLPGMSGPDLQLHLSSIGRQLPIVFITAFDESAERLRPTAARLGARAFVDKPFGSNDLLEAVRYALVDD